ncbi:MAG: hypothetical protein MUF00_07720 [Gemmatimonadaceae bacterium]|jgi:hypothetical protein|nr:hypothetical protein [Gemmatimonadaceae bacterium]
MVAFTRLLRRPLAVTTVGSLLIGSLSGCYQITPITTGLPAPSAAGLRVHLSAAGTERVAATLGPFIVAVDATRETGAADSVVLRVTRAFHQAGTDENRSGDIVRLAPTDVERVEARRLSKGRTALVIALVAGLLGAIPAVASSSGGGGLTPGGTTPP